MRRDVYVAVVAGHTDAYNDLNLPEQRLYSFSPIGRGDVWISGVNRLCLGSNMPIGQIDVPDDAALNRRESDFGPATEILEWAGGSISAYQARCQIVGRAE